MRALKALGNGLSVGSARVLRRVRLGSRSLRYWWQRRTRGWDDSDLWDLAETTAKFMLPRLRRFVEYHHGYPADLDPQEWNRILGEMIWLLECHA